MAKTPPAREGASFLTRVLQGEGGQFDEAPATPNAHMIAASTAPRPVPGREDNNRERGIRRREDWTRITMVSPVSCLQQCSTKHQARYGSYQMFMGFIQY